MKNKILAFVTFLCVNVISSFAQIKIELENKLQQNSITQFASFKSKVEPNANNKLLVLNTFANEEPNITFKKIETQIISKNLNQDKYQIYVNGIVARGGEYSVHYNNEKILFVNGFFAKVNTEASVNKMSKLNIVANAIRYFDEPINETTKKDPQLIYYYDYKTELYQLAYEVLLQAKNSFRVENVYVAVNDGSILGAESKICSTNFTGNAQTQYNGNQTIVTDAPNAGGPFRLYETRSTNNVIIHTRNNNFAGIEVTGATDMFDNDNNWTFAEHGNLRAGFDAHWGAETVFDYWLQVHNRNSINNAGMQISSYINPLAELIS